MAALRPSSFRTTLLLRTRLAPSSTPTHPCRFARPSTPLLSYSTDAAAAPPPLLAKLKSDLKTAMRAKDAARLTVLRAILAATLNASKTSTPVSTDAQVVSLLRRTRRAALEARAEAEAAGRPDLVEKEAAEVRVLDEYVAGSGVEELGEAQLRGIVEAAVADAGGEGKARFGDVMKVLLAPGGPLAGKDVEKAELAGIVKELV